MNEEHSNANSDNLDTVIHARHRPDLLMTKSNFEGRLYCVVKDPVSLNYFRFEPKEYRLLELIDGKRTSTEIIERYEREFPPEKLSPERLDTFIQSMAMNELILLNTMNEGDRLYDTSVARKSAMRRQKWSNFLFIKLPGFDPEPSLKWLHPRLSWLFSFWGLALSVAFMLGTLVFLALKFDEFSKRPEMEAFQAFFNLENVIWFWVAIGISKVIHEYGHGLSCKHFGGECHDMGVLLLIFTPCFYCNVSDSWMNSNRWSRMFVSMAGIYVELMLASIATFVWWFSQPGIIHNIAFATMFYCSFNTFFVNANPLLRYDGYYVMVDLLETPNLIQKSFQLMEYYVYKFLFGVEVAQPAMLPERHRIFFVLYAIAAYLYRFVVLFVILWFLYNVLQPYKLAVISYILGSIALVKLVGAPLWSVASNLIRNEEWRAQLNYRRAFISVALIVGGITSAFLVPIPKRVSGHFTIAHANEESVYVSTAGTVEQVFVEPGQEVRTGQVLIELKSREIEQEIIDAKSKLELLKVRQKVNIETGNDTTAHSVTSLIKEQQEFLENRERKKDELTIQSPGDGVLVSVPTRQAPKFDSRKINRLQPWSGQPLSQRTEGAYLESGTKVCIVGEPNSFQAVLYVPQSDLKFVDLEQPVRLCLDAYPSRHLSGTVSSVGYDDIASVPSQLSNFTNGGIPTRASPVGGEEPLDSYYQVLVNLDADVQGEMLRHGLRGKAVIRCGTVTVVDWAWRLFSKTIRF